MMVQLFVNPINFILGGNANFTIKSKKTNRMFTYQVRQSKSKPNIKNVFLIEDHKLNPIGAIISNSFFKARDKNINETLPAIAFKFMFELHKNNNTNTSLEFFHHMKCGRCNRFLTTQDSIKNLFGPSCFEKVRNAK